jgi:hypothetical protein
LLARPPSSGNRPRTAAFVVAEVNGAWGKAIEAPGTAVLSTGGLGDISQVSCAPRGPCTAAGSYGDRSNRTGAYFLSEAGRVWGRLQQVRGIAPLVGGSSGIASLSCPRAGRCSAVGLYTMGPGDPPLLPVRRQPAALRQPRARPVRPRWTRLQLGGLSVTKGHLTGRSAPPVLGSRLRDGPALLSRASCHAEVGHLPWAGPVRRGVQGLEEIACHQTPQRGGVREM